MAKKLRLGVLISGRGTNLQAIIDACESPDFPAEIAIVISNRPNAGGLDRAKSAGLNTLVIDHKDFGKGEEGRSAFEAPLTAALEDAGVDLICAAGFMRLTTKNFTTKWRGRFINIHPSLLPAFKGLNVHERMIEQGVKVAGCTVHFVSAEMDSGAIIGQAALAVAPADTAETLAERILVLEHQLYPACIRLIAEGGVKLASNGRAALSPALTPDATIVFPAL